MRRSTILSVLAGACASAALGGAVLVGLGLTGIRRAPNELVSGAVVVVVAGLAWLASRALEDRWFRLGGFAFGAFVLARALLTDDGSLGPAEWLALGGGLGVVLAGTALLRLLELPITRWVLVLGVVVVAAGLVRVVLGGGGFGHDESAYALKGRSWVFGTPATGWSVHRGWVQSAIAAGVLPITSSELVMRLVSVLLAILTVVSVWWLGRTVAGFRVGVIAAAVFATGPSFLRRGAEFLTDVPTTGLLLAATGLVWRWLTDSTRGDGSLYAAVALVAFGFYWRYQVLLSAALIAISGLLLYWPSVKARTRPLLMAGGLGVLALVPHAVYATSLRGNPLGILTATGDVAGRAYLGEGLVDYARAFPDLLAGQIGALAIVGALAWMGRCLVRSRRLGLDDTERTAFFLAVPAVGQILALGVISHGEPRFVFYPVALLVIVASIGLNRLTSRVPAGWERIGSVTLVTAVVCLLGLNLSRIDHSAEARAASTLVLQEAAAHVRSAAEGACGVVTSYTPQITWFSECTTALPGISEPVMELEPEGDRFLMLFANGKRQPEGEVLDGYLRLTDGDPTTIVDTAGAIGDARIWRFKRP